MVRAILRGSDEWAPPAWQWQMHLPSMQGMPVMVMCFKIVVAGHVRSRHATPGSCGEVLDSWRRLASVLRRLGHQYWAINALSVTPAYA